MVATTNMERLIILPLLRMQPLVKRRVRQVGGEKRMPPTRLLPPLLSRGIAGSRLHHWLPRPSRVPVFHRTRVLASTLCPTFLRSS